MRHSQILTKKKSGKIKKFLPVFLFICVAASLFIFTKDTITTFLADKFGYFNNKKILPQSSVFNAGNPHKTQVLPYSAGNIYSAYDNRFLRNNNSPNNNCVMLTNDFYLSGNHNSTDTLRQRNPKEPKIFDKLRSSDSHPISERIKALAEELTKNATNDVGKARAIYDYITANILYDTEEWEHITQGGEDYSHPHDPDSVLERGTTVCIGYAWLFNHLCKAAGIESKWLIGDVRGYRGTPDDELISEFRHAWNVVKLDDDAWHLLDSTWGAKQEGEEKSDYEGRADYYFDTPSNQFVFDHLPEESEWQLLDEPIPSENAFSVLPNLKPAFFTDGIGLTDAYTSTLMARSGTMSALSFTKPDGVTLKATIITGNDAQTEKPIKVEESEGNTVAVIPSLESGSYLIRIYTGKGSSVLNCAADFQIIVQ